MRAARGGRLAGLRLQLQRDTAMNLQNISLIGVAVAISVLIAYLVSGGRGDDLQFVLHNLNAVQEDVERLHKKVDGLSRQYPGASGRLAPELAREYEGDQAFLEEVVALKKRRMLAELRQQIRRLEGEDEGVAVAPDTQAAEALAKAGDFSVYTINYSGGFALLKVGGQVQQVEAGDNLGRFVVDGIEPDRVVLHDPELQQNKVLRLVYNAEVQDIRTSPGTDAAYASFPPIPN